MRPRFSSALVGALAFATIALAAKSDEAVDAVVTVKWPKAKPATAEPLTYSWTPSPPAAPTPVAPQTKLPFAFPSKPQDPASYFAVLQPNDAASASAGFLIGGGRVVTILPDDQPPADSPRVRGVDGDRAATVIAYDSGTGLALLKLDSAGDGPTLRLADSAPALGESVRTVYEYRDRVPAMVPGSVATPPHYDPAMGAFVVRTTVPVSPGTAGAPLLNDAGQVIGVVKGMVSAGGQSGPAIVVAGEHLLRLLAFVEGGGSGELKPPRLGAALKSADAESGDGASRTRAGGALITQIVSGSAAEAAGLKAGERITAIDGTKVRRYEDAIGLIRRNAAGDEVELAVVSADGEARTVTATLGSEPPPIASVENIWVEVSDLPSGRAKEAERLYDWILKDDSLNESLTDEQRERLRERIESRLNRPGKQVIPLGQASPPLQYRAIITPEAPQIATPPRAAEPSRTADADVQRTIENLRRQIDELSKRLEAKGE